jgi:hypothetical protein
MARRILNKSSAGDATTFGSNDLDYVNQLLTGVDQTGTDPVLMNTLFRVYGSKLRFRSTGAGTPDYTIVNPSGTAARNLTIPNLAQDDTIAVLTEPQTFAGKTIPFATNTLTGVASTTTTQTLTGKTIDAADTTNTISNVIVSPDKKSVGYWMPTVTTDRSGDGILSGAIATPTGSTGAINNLGTVGRAMLWTSAAVTDNYAGLRFSTAAAVIRNKECRLKIKFRINDTAAIRFFCGFSTRNTNETGDTATDSSSTFMLALRSTDTNFMVAHNGGGNASTTFIDTGVAKDTAIHIFEVKAPAGDTGFQWSFDGGAFSSTVTTPIPSSTIVLMPHCYVQTTGAAAKTLDVWYIILEQNP